MIFNTGSALLDAIVLAVVSKAAEGTYGYKITQDVRLAIDKMCIRDRPCPVSDTEVTVILGNLLENAVEACLREKDAKDVYKRQYPYPVKHGVIDHCQENTDTG